MKTKPNTPSPIRRAALCAVLIVSVVLTGCETPAQTALLGAAVGAGAGYAAGTAVQNQRNRSYNQGYRDSRYNRYDSRTRYNNNVYYYDSRGLRHY